MFYIHQTSCISAQQTFAEPDLESLHDLNEKKLLAREPLYDTIPPGVLRRMGKAVRMATGAALPILQKNQQIDGIIIGTSNAGKTECGNFLNQLLEYDEGMLTPVNFVQGTPNAAAAQIGLLSNNQGYNITHVQLGLSFEYALLDADMLLQEDPSRQYLLGAVDDISNNYYQFELKSGYIKKEIESNKSLYSSDSSGSIAGEAAVMFIVNKKKNGAAARIIGAFSIHETNVGIVQNRLNIFLKKNIPEGENVDLLLSGENGNNLLMDFYQACESVMDKDVPVARFKHMFGEFPTASATALWLSCFILKSQTIPEHMIKKPGKISSIRNILIYNCYKGFQHSFMLVSMPD